MALPITQKVSNRSSPICFLRKETVHRHNCLITTKLHYYFYKEKARVLKTEDHHKTVYDIIIKAQQYDFSGLVKVFLRKANISGNL